MRRVSRGRSLALSIFVLGAGSLITLYFLNLLPFARRLSLITDEDVRAYLVRSGICQNSFLFVTKHPAKSVWRVACESPNGTVVPEFVVYGDGRTMSALELLP